MLKVSYWDQSMSVVHRVCRQQLEMTTPQYSQECSLYKSKPNPSKYDTFSLVNIYRKLLTYPLEPIVRIEYNLAGIFPRRPTTKQIKQTCALLNLSSWCLVMVERFFLALLWGCLLFVIVVFPDHTHLLFLVLQKHDSQRRDLWQLRKLLESSLKLLII